MDFESNIGLVRHVLHRTFPTWLNTEEGKDLFQEGCIGLLKAIDRYDGRVKFSSFAVPYIRGEILHYLRDKLKLVRHRTEEVRFASLDRLLEMYEADDEGIPNRAILPLFADPRTLNDPYGAIDLEMAIESLEPRSREIALDIARGATAAETIAREGIAAITYYRRLRALRGSLQRAIEREKETGASDCPKCGGRSRRARKLYHCTRCGFHFDPARVYHRERGRPKGHR
jgi:RNA polymerase sigma factor (sigma-70 family)